MNAVSEEPLFSPALYEMGAGCSWDFSHVPTISMNNWFIAAPGAGVYRDDWLQDVEGFRNQVRSGTARVIIMDASKTNAWFRPVASVAEALALKVGDTFYISIKARVAEGKDVVLQVCFYGAKQIITATDKACVITIPGDGAWHEV